MSLALIGLYIFFLIGGHVTSITILCGISSALLQYFILAFFGWTAVEAVWLYLKLVKVFGTSSFTSKFTLKSGIPTWRKYLNRYKESALVNRCGGAWLLSPHGEVSVVTSARFTYNSVSASMPHRIG